jgi:aconitate hydratase
MAFMASPEIVMAYGLSGRLSFNPLTDSLEAEDGSQWKLEPPKPAPDIPEDGFIFAREGYVPPVDNGASVQVVIAEHSERLELLQPFASPEERQFLNLPLLLKTKGKTTTDHISPAGRWLRYRGHLDKISDNMFTGAINAFTGSRGKTRNPVTGDADRPVPEVARAILSSHRKWVVVGDENYGEGSSREHAAMSPRLLGAGVIIARSFARIHETNLKKQGVLALTFADAADYEKVRETDEISITRLADLEPKSTLLGTLHHADGTMDEIDLEHTLNVEQVAWFRAGSALNLLRMHEESESRA